jgi:hypothetical protein
LCQLKFCEYMGRILFLVFPSISMCLGTHINLILLCSAIFTKDWWHSQVNWNLSVNCQGTW